jgi:uncharacterized protein (DUF885 family)
VNNATSKHFEGVLTRYFEGLLKDSPTYSVAGAGLTDGEGQLGRADQRFHDHRQQERIAALSNLAGISPRELSNEQQLDRLALRSHLLKDSEDHQRGRHRMEPNAPEGLFSILLHELQRGDDEPKRAARNLRSLLKQAPDFLVQSSKVVRHPERVWLQVMDQTIAGSGTLLDGVAEFLKTDPGAADGELLAGTRRALKRYSDHVHNLRPAPPNSFAIGAVTMQRRVRDELGLDYDLGQVEALAMGEARRLEALLKKACARFGRGLSPAEVISRARGNWRPGGPLVELYRKETTRVANGFRAARAVTFPVGDELEVRAVPDFLRNLIPTAAYNQPGAFSKRQRGIFWVNDLSVTRKTPAQKLAEQQQHFGVPLTCAHEAYPGHHLQFVTANRHPRRWRRLYAHAVFYEGWTLWCEQMMVDLRIDRSPWLEVQQLHDALWRCHRILVDLRLQTGRYTHELAVGHLCRHVGFTRARAQADVNWYTAQPGVPMSYWLGRLENERLRKRLVAGRGWPLRKFNDWLLSFGTLPQAWIEKYGLD